MAILRRKPAELDGSLPRDNHYVFAHVALRQVAAQDPLAFLGVVASQEGPHLLHSLWNEVTRQCKRPRARASMGDFLVHPSRVGDLPLAVITLPPPQAITEAYLVGVVLLTPLEELREEDPPEEVPMRYFTLEHGLSFPPEEPGEDPEPATRTVFCEWSHQGEGTAHLNHGDGCPPRPEAFAALISGALAGERERG